jgi:hypothetical protein
MRCLALLISGRLGRRSVRVGMRDRTHLGDEKRQHSQGRDAKFEAMRPFEQGQPLCRNDKMLAPSVKTGNRLPIGRRLLSLEKAQLIIPWLITSFQCSHLKSDSDVGQLPYCHIRPPAKPAVKSTN